MNYKEYHTAIDKLAVDSLNIVCTTGDSVWDTDAMVCGLDTSYSETAALILRIKEGCIHLHEEDVQGLIQYLTTVLPLFKERDAITAAYNETMKLESED